VVAGVVSQAASESSEAQRRRLESEARDRGASVGGLVREAIDTRFGVSGEGRVTAVRTYRRRANAARRASPGASGRRAPAVPAVREPDL